MGLNVDGESHYMLLNGVYEANDGSSVKFEDEDEDKDFNPHVRNSRKTFVGLVVSGFAGKGWGGKLQLCLVGMLRSEKMSQRNNLVKL